MAACPVCYCEDTKESSVPGLHRCPACTHLFQWPLEVRAHYDFEYLRTRYESYPTVDAMSHLRLGFVRAMHPSGGKLLDVGYGNGAFLKLAGKAGFTAFGNDVHGCGHQFGVHDVSLNGDHYDVVTFFDSLEHFASLERPREVCRLATTVIVSMPCLPESEADIPTWKHFRPGEHLHYFTERSLARFMGDKFCLTCLNLEDTVRGDRHGDWNITTSAWRALPIEADPS